MSAEIAIIGGFGIIASMLAFYAYQFYAIGGKLERKLALGLTAFSFVFVLLTMLSMYLIGVNQAPYLSNSVLFGGLKVMLALVGLFTMYMLFIVFYYIFKGFYSIARNIFGRTPRKEEDNDGE